MSLKDWDIDPHFPLPTLLVNVEVFSYTLDKMLDGKHRMALKKSDG